MMNIKQWIYLGVIAGGLFLSFSAASADEEIYAVSIKDHQFSPAELKIPANSKVKIIVENQDQTAEEFESYDLNREKVVTGNGKITIFIGPLKSGTYKYFGEFHKDSAQGVIIVE